MNFRFTAYWGFIFLFLSGFAKAQNPAEDFEKEKTYIQTSHVFYKPGETMDFKIYVVEANDNRPAKHSRVVNFEMTDPGGSVIRKSKHEVNNGHAEGSVYFDEGMKGGIYKIKAYTDWMQNEDGKNAFAKEITLQKIVSPRILMKLDFPKKGYGAGDEVSADFSMRSLSGLPIPFYEGHYTVLHNGKTVSEGKLLTDKEGKSLLKFHLPEVLDSPDALLHITVKFDGFMESISRNIPVVLNNIEVKFMPEGGTFINGIRQNIAFKISDESGNPVDATLGIYNRKHQQLAEVQAYHFGMGSFLFQPERGETYYAKVIKPENISKIYPLPVAGDQGIVLNVEKEDGNIRLKITAPEAGNITIKGNFRGKEVYSRPAVMNKGENFVELPEKDLPAGICRFTVYENCIPQAERIVFANEDRRMQVKIEPSKKNYLPREKVTLDIETTDENGSPVPANLAMAVVDDKLWTYADDKQNHILSWLLLDSELHGKIERPQFYFDKKEAKAKKSLDLVMLTNGYRYFELLPEIISSGKYKYLPEKRNPVYGIVEDENKRPVKAEVFLLEENSYGKSKIVKQVTGENGTFYFTDLKGAVNYKIIAKSFQPKQEIEVRILAYKLNINPLEKQKIKAVDVEEVVAEAVRKTISKEMDRKTDPAAEKPSGRAGRSDTISKDQNIEEVVVMGALGIRRTKFLTGAVTVLEKEEINRPNISSLAGKVAGLEISPSGNQTNGYITIRGSRSLSNKSPLFIVDGVPVENFDTNVYQQDLNSVTVLKDAAATALYGSRGTNGVVLITSARYGNSAIKLDITPKTYFSVKSIPQDSLDFYTIGRQFSYPVYETTDTAYRFDYREVLYWNPVVETDSNGKAKVEFYNSDANTTFRVITEGISAAGSAGRDETTYAAQSMISIDAKIPQYLTRTDIMSIPVVIKNNAAESRTMTLDVIVPNRVQLVKSDSIITLKPLESGRLYVKIRMDDVIDSNIQFAVKSGNFRETMILPFQVGEKGFPHQYSIIDNKTEDLKINIPDHISNSLYSSYFVYNNRALQMFEDLERLKREPYGCFEQLSSTVYPNVFILDYLKSLGKINAETENEVVRNLKKGYQKMLSYRNRDGGFSYFGSSESDVALSAFALLEFEALKRYIAIDPKIIRDLTAFILSGKNTNGTFRVKRSYETGASSSDYQWSRNIYVLYALSKNGIKDQLEEAYQVSLKRALAVKDSYQLALMANISSDFGRFQDYDRIIEILNSQFVRKEVKTKATFTGSWGNSAHAETVALYLMALQKDKRLSPLQLTGVADDLINCNGYYGFGSTQATTLALEALSGFFAKNEKSYGTDKPVIKINGADIQQNTSIISALQKGENTIAVSYPAQTGLPYKLEYGYYSLKAPQSADIPVMMETKLASENLKAGEISRMSITVKNKINGPLPMVTAKIGIPAGLTLQNALLKDMLEKKQISYYEIFDNYLVLYWEHFEADETKRINLDLKVEFAGEYTGKASNIYLYYMPEAKYWNEGIKVNVQP
ncbi:TonB-dependent receptor plug domain-containing protein [Chryseobacterium sp. SN22]|uniref:TonB-dependent receptor plug domain-containing protein n=1 Tax=Chryseobacterium sp. SN22 TaxID=2606431 RepID=UPI0011EC1941|nr:TonB-dependent receptor plug domain-containing protein [Chryseobacterium sp. SN22]KAA0128440.1 TonB-dependent receptor plug domain-containing protein [Chryseobacterium sp. SN22]